jgi:hypothetical protein
MTMNSITVTPLAPIYNPYNHKPLKPLVDFKALVYLKLLKPLTALKPLTDLKPLKLLKALKPLINKILKW